MELKELSFKDVYADCPMCGFEGPNFVITEICTPFNSYRIQVSHTTECPVYLSAIDLVIAGSESQNTHRNYSARDGEDLYVAKKNDVRPRRRNR